MGRFQLKLRDSSIKKVLDKGIKFTGGYTFEWVNDLIWVKKKEKKLPRTSHLFEILWKDAISRAAYIVQKQMVKNIKIGKLWKYNPWRKIKRLDPRPLPIAIQGIIHKELLRNKNMCMLQRNRRNWESITCLQAC